MKRVLLFLLCIVLMISFCSCKNPYSYDCKPCHQPGTYWVSEDGNISFYVHSYDRVMGKICVDGEELEVQFWWNNIFPPLEIYSIDFLTDTVHPYEHEDEYYVYERWSYTLLGKDKFIAVVRETTYFEEGEIIVFKKTEVGDNEIVYPPDTTGADSVSSDETNE